MSPHPVSFRIGLGLILGGILAFLAVPQKAGGDWDATREAFSYTPGGDIDETLGQIALYLLDRNRQEGSAFISTEVEEGIVGYQLRYSDNGDKVVSTDDWFGIRRYRIPADPDTTLPSGYYKNIYMELVDVGLNGIDNRDYYFIDGRRFDLANEPGNVLQHYQVQMEKGVSTFVRQVGYNTVFQSGELGQTSIKKMQAYDDGSLPARMILGLDLRYIFRPITKNAQPLSEEEMMREIRQSLGFVYSATMGYTDLSGYRFRDIADQTALLQRTYDPMEISLLSLILGALFDTDSDGVINQDDLQNGYTRFREIHQQLADNARGLNRRVVLPGEKLARLRQEYETVQKKPFIP